jgi:hypothetical protein
VFGSRTPIQHLTAGGDVPVQRRKVNMSDYEAEDEGKHHRRDFAALGWSTIEEFWEDQLRRIKEYAEAKEANRFSKFVRIPDRDGI